MPPPTNRKPVWYHPRDDKGDRILSYVIDARQTKNNDQQLLSPHWLASSDPNYEGLVFLHREPMDDGAFARDWYGPESLVDDRIRVSNVGTGHQSGLLYSRGSTPPTLDDRVGVKGLEVASHSLTWAWSIHPDTTLVGVDFVHLTIDGFEQFTGDEVYVEITDVGDLTAIEPGTHVIARHIDSNTIQIAATYDVEVVPFGVVAGTVYEACYILDGYSDTESAPGILADKFHLRSFTYRLGTPSYSYQWDETLGLKLTQETRAVPATWARLWLPGFPTAAESDEESSVGYSAISKLVYNRVKSGVEDGDLPDEDGASWTSAMRINIPAICTDIRIALTWSSASSDDGETVSRAEDWGTAADTWGPGQVGVDVVTLRKVCKTADISTTRAEFLAHLGAGTGGTSPPLPIGGLSSTDLFSFEPKAYSILTGTYSAHGGDNIWTKAQVRPYTAGPFLVKDGSLDVYVPNSGISSGSGTPLNLDNNSVKTLTGVNPPWGEAVLWDQTTTKARWGYWILDFVCVILPLDPS